MPIFAAPTSILHVPKRTGITAVPPVVDAGVEVPAPSVVRSLGSLLEQMMNQDQSLANLLNQLQTSTDRGQSPAGQVYTQLEQTINQIQSVVDNLPNQLQSPGQLPTQLQQAIKQTQSLAHSIANQLQFNLAALQQRLQRIVYQVQEFASLPGLPRLPRLPQIRDDGEILIDDLQFKLKRDGI
ncbi:hypothetical protein BU17DRAFT_60338 [Hysterangium stoloniferum]|nr:hypothetical protein BU17DRAFT_60338 [Hysterangium stoloniferum]